MILNAQNLLRNKEMACDILTQYCLVMECSQCTFKKHNIACNRNAAGQAIPWNEWLQKEVKKFE